DMLLTRGKIVWGFANDDSHHEGDTALAWNVVQVPETQDVNPQSIIDALQAGQFYASTGVVIDDIRAEGSYLNIRAANAKRINLIADRGQRVLQIENNELHFRVPDDSSWRYLRVELWGEGETQAWTQPIIVKQD
ncbi:MAG: hypothetical protein AAF267_05165, partial [Deinococcota bacterium]